MPSLAVRFDARKKSNRSIDDTTQVDIEHEIPIRMGGLIHWDCAGHPGVVAEHVDIAEDALSLIGRALDCIPVCDIQSNQMEIFVRAIESSRRSVEMLLANVRDDDLHAMSEEGACHPKSDATCSSGDESNLIF
ncbi:hypothetical protein AS156_18590 [Bradyrhizobium macuxiense]|uniref:Uncharacterized protein n=1 Tax=Bradyrhizobium macuxiense TaxID=1755647 RepID=A0A125Q6N4_9BRAD|nr:hypothetical protein AS156_18590 [Bradyrhizobium macuxiense]